MKICLYGIMHTLLLLVIFASCKHETENRRKSLLDKAEEIIETNPEESLTLLDSIANPQSMDKKSYMWYIVNKIQAKYKTSQDITKDILILQAERYFRDTNDNHRTAYAGCYFFKKQMPNETYYYYLQAETASKKDNNNLLIAKSLHAAGHIYYNEDILNYYISIEKLQLKCM